MLDDELDEPDESFTVTLSQATNATIADQEGQGTITDNDVLPSLGIDDVSVAEDGGSALFTVTLSDPYDEAVTVVYATRDGTAEAGSVDYSAASGTLTIDAGSLTGTISVPVLDDTLDEPDETFTVTLSQATNATIADQEGQGTITDNDVLPSLGIDDVSVAEDGGSALFTVTLSDTYDEAVTVVYATRDGTAEAGSDYSAASGTLTIDAGSLTGTISVPVLDDTLDEPDETFTVTLPGDQRNDCRSRRHGHNHRQR